MPIPQRSGSTSEKYENRADRAAYRERAAAPLWRYRTIVSYLTDELVRMGHDVTLFASGDSVSGANLVRCVPRRCGWMPMSATQFPITC